MEGVQVGRPELLETSATNGPTGDVETDVALVGLERGRLDRWTAGSHVSVSKVATVCRFGSMYARSSTEVSTRVSSFWASRLVANPRRRVCFARRRVA
jgi:hypothetical protein